MATGSILAHRTPRAERTGLIVTTNLPFESWPDVLGSERLGGASLDRLTHRCRNIETTP